MIVTCVHVWVKKNKVNNFIEATIPNHQGTLREEGNLRFDVLQDAGDSSKFVLYEVFESEEAILAHKETPHYLAWKQTVEPWMEQPRQGVKHHVVCPLDMEQW